MNEVVKLRGGDEEEPVIFEITEFIIEDGSVEISIPGKAMTVALPRIELRDIGKDSGGITSDELAKKILGQVTGSVRKTVKDVAGIAVKKGVEVGVEVKEKVTGVAEESVKGVKNLFNKVKQGK